MTDGERLEQQSHPAGVNEAAGSAFDAVRLRRGCRRQPTHALGNAETAEEKALGDRAQHRAPTVVPAIARRSKST